MKTSKFALLAMVTLALGTTLQSCDKNKEIDGGDPVESAKTFAVGGLVSDPDGAYLLQTASLSEGEISFLGKGANVTTQEPGFLAFMTKDGFYYSYKSDEKTLTKYSYDNQKLTLVKVIPFDLAEGYRYNHQWIDSKTLMIYGYKGAFKIINVADMTVAKEGQFNLPAKDGLTGPIVGFAEVKDSKLHVGYYYGDESYPAANKPGQTNYATGTAYFAVFNYPALDNPVFSEDSRSTVPGNYRNGVLKTFTYNDDLYIMTAPFEMVGVNWDKPHGIYRIKKGTSVVDKSYFLDLSAKLNGDAVLGGAYAGNGKLVIRRVRMDLAQKWSDYGFAAVHEYHVVDMATGNLTKLNVPVSKSQPTAPNVLADEGKVYFTVNTKTDNGGDFYIYSYDSASGELKKGVKVNDVDRVNGLFRIK